jgi:hypothetical protein
MPCGFLFVVLWWRIYMNEILVLARRYLRIFLCVFIYSFSLSSAWSATLTERDAAKTSPDVIERAKANTPQQLFVELEHKEIKDRENEKRRARNLPFNDRKLGEEAKLEFDALKKVYSKMGG